MENLKFDVMRDKWIPVIKRVKEDGEVTEKYEEMSIHEVFSQAHKIKELASHNVLDNIAILRLLDVFYMDIFRPKLYKDRDDWDIATGHKQGSGEYVHGFNMDIFNKALNAMETDDGKRDPVPLFDLFDRERPFLQHPYVAPEQTGKKKAKKTLPVASMSEFMYSETQRMICGGRREYTLTAAEYARELVKLPCINFVANRGNGQMIFTPLNNAIFMVQVGDNLMQTIILSSVSEEELHCGCCGSITEWGKPTWKEEPRRWSDFLSLEELKKKFNVNKDETPKKEELERRYYCKDGVDRFSESLLSIMTSAPFYITGIPERNRDDNLVVRRIYKRKRYFASKAADDTTFDKKDKLYRYEDPQIMLHASRINKKKKKETIVTEKMEPYKLGGDYQLWEGLDACCVGNIDFGKSGRPDMDVVKAPYVIMKMRKSTRISSWSACGGQKEMLYVYHSEINLAKNILCLQNKYGSDNLASREKQEYGYESPKTDDKLNALFEKYGGVKISPITRKIPKSDKKDVEYGANSSEMHGFTSMTFGIQKIIDDFAKAARCEILCKFRSQDSMEAEQRRMCNEVTQLLKSYMTCNYFNIYVKQYEADMEQGIITSEASRLQIQKEIIAQFYKLCMGYAEHRIPENTLENIAVKYQFIKNIQRLYGDYDKKKSDKEKEAGAGDKEQKEVESGQENS